MTEDPARVRTRLWGRSMIAAPVLLLASTVAYTLGGGFNDDSTGGVIQIFAFALWIPVLVGLTELVGRSFPRAAALLMLLGAIGLAGGFGYGLDSIHQAETGNSAEDFTAGPLALQLPGALFPLTMVSLGIALVKARVQPVWAGYLLAIAAILFPASRIPSVEALGIASDLLFLIALAPLGLTMMRNEALGHSFEELSPHTSPHTSAPRQPA